MMAFGTMGLFGVAHIVSSGAFLLWAIVLFSDCPDFGLGLPFLMIALGQTAGGATLRNRMGCGGEWDGAAFLCRNHGKCCILDPERGLDTQAGERSATEHAVFSKRSAIAVEGWRGRAGE
jgi:hypothetical protein